jgi:transcriptional regulator with XRE-family HTH domain
VTGQELNALFGENIRYYRERKGWTQKELSGQIGTCSNSFICDLERGRHLPSCRNLALLAFILGVEVWQLFCDRDKECNYDPHR